MKATRYLRAFCTAIMIPSLAIVMIESAADGAAAGTCSPTSTRLCLLDGRFSVETRFRSRIDGVERAAELVPFVGADDSGLFHFDFGAGNWELVVKAADLCSSNGIFTLLAAAATDYEYVVTIEDTIARVTKEFRNADGDLPSLFRTAFDTCDAATTARANEGNSPGVGNRDRTQPHSPEPVESFSVADIRDSVAVEISTRKESVTASQLGSRTLGEDFVPPSCVSSDTKLCLLGQRIEVQLQFRSRADGILRSATVVPGSVGFSSGLFYFEFGPENWEFLVKASDLCSSNQIVTVLGAAATDYEYILDIKDTMTGKVKTATNTTGSRPSLFRVGFEACASAIDQGTIGGEALFGLIENSPYRTIGDIRNDPVAGTNGIAASSPGSSRPKTAGFDDPGEFRSACDLSGARIYSCRIERTEGALVPIRTVFYDDCQDQFSDGTEFRTGKLEIRYPASGLTEGCPADLFPRDQRHTVIRQLLDEVETSQYHQSSRYNTIEQTLEVANGCDGSGFNLDKDIVGLTGIEENRFDVGSPTEDVLTSLYENLSESIRFCGDETDIRYRSGSRLQRSVFRYDDGSTIVDVDSYSYSGLTYSPGPRTGRGLSTSVTGKIGSGCTLVQAEARTLSPIVFEQLGACPTQGVVELRNGQTLIGRATFGAGGKIRFEPANGTEVREYSSCDDPSLRGVCGG